MFDLTEMDKYFEDGQPFSNYASKDISYALAKYSNLKEDTDVKGYGDLSSTELEILDNWVLLFLYAPIIDLIATRPPYISFQAPIQGCGRTMYR